MTADEVVNPGIEAVVRTVAGTRIEAAGDPCLLVGLTAGTVA